jgi:hypothetical protein
MFSWWNSWWEWEGTAAKNCILRGDARSGMRVRGLLDLSAERMDPLPDDLHAETIQLSDCAYPRRLPRRLSCLRLILRRSAIEELPSDLNVMELVDAQDCRHLASIGAISVAELNLGGCTSLESLPVGLSAHVIDLTGCYRLEGLPADFGRTTKTLCLRDCPLLTELPDGMLQLESLDVRGCRRLTSLPDSIRIRSWIDVAGSGLVGLPWSLRSVRVRWNGVPISDRIAFDPDSITISEILGERNAVVRRVLLERVGYEWFVDNAQAMVVDADQDSGGDRRLLRIPLDGEEDLLFVEVHCPSTKSRYLLRVPPNMTTCRQAVAWTAGFAAPNAYRPIQET